MIPNYDNWLLNQAEQHFRDCEPEITHIYVEYEGPGETSESYTYSCQECDDKTCPYWAEYNEDGEE